MDNCDTHVHDMGVNDEFRRYINLQYDFKVQGAYEVDFANQCLGGGYLSLIFSHAVHSSHTLVTIHWGS